MGNLLDFLINNKTCIHLINYLLKYNHEYILFYISKVLSVKWVNGSNFPAVSNFSAIEIQ